MTNNEKTPAAAPAKSKKGQVVIDGISINDDWARKLKPKKLQKADGSGPEEKVTSAEEQFKMNFESHPNLQEMEPAERDAWIKKAFKECLEAED